MALGANISNLELSVLGKFALDGEVVLVGKLRPHVRLKIAIEQNWLKERPILGRAWLGSDEAIEGIGISCTAILSDKWSVELSFREENAAAKRRLSAKLLEHELLHGVIKHSITSTKTGLTGIPGTPGDSDALGECLGVGLSRAR